MFCDVCAHVVLLTICCMPGELSDDNSGEAYADRTVSTVIGLE